MTDPILQKILSLMTSVLLLMQQMLVTVPSTPPVTISDKPFLPETSFVRQAKSGNKLGAFNVSAGGTYRLQSSISSSATSITLSSFKEPVSDIKYTMSYLDTSIIYGTLEPSSQTNKELISATGITQNADGTATLTGVTRGLGFSAPFTSSSTLQKSHAGQSVFILSDAPGVFNKFANKDNNETISGTWTFTSTAAPKYNTGYTASGEEFVPFSQLNATAIAGAGTSTEAALGLVELATKAETAAGTASSTTGAPLVIKNGSATSTYNAGLGGNFIPVTNTSNVLDPNFIATSSSHSYTWAASTTFSGTTTINATSATNNALILNGVKYRFPNSNTSSSSALVNDASGNLSWADVGGLYYLNLSPSPVSGTTASTTIFSTPISGGLLKTGNVLRGKVLVSNFFWSVTERPAFELGYGTGTTTLFFPVNTSVANNVGGFIEFYLSANGATNSQKLTLLLSAGTTTGAITTTLSQDSTTAKQLILRAKATDTTPTNFVISDQVIIDYLPVR